MATFIPEETLSDIKNATNIVDVISEAVLLKKRGKDFIGLCPFHSEKTPSFSVSPDKQIFYCFGCATGGNVFSFLMKHEGLTFPEAARRLARQSGIEIPTQAMTPEQKRRVSERDTLFSINQKAMELFHGVLLSQDRGNRALAYLKKREMTGDTIEKFNLGFAPEGWDHIVNYFSKKGVPLEVVEKSGLIVPKQKGKGYYDRFRGRIMFPILDGNRRPIGFGGRGMGDEQPKYLNSPETPLYHKGRSLYGLSDARGKCRESGTVHIVEGYFDFLSLYQRGIKNVVATLGTALTVEHVRILKGYADRFILVYDSDEAGVKAANRSIGIFMQEGVDAQIIILPTGYDPDSYMTEFGPDSFIDVSRKALGVIPFLVDTAVKAHGLSVEGKIRVIEDMKGPLAGIEDPIARSLHIKRLAEILGIDEAAVLERIREHAGSRRKSEQEIRGSTRSYRSPVPAELQGKSHGNGGDRFERQIISMMLQFPEILPEIETRSVLDRFKDESLKLIGQTILAHFPRLENDISELLGHIDDSEERNLITRLSMGNFPWDLKGCLDLLKQFESIRFRQEDSLLKEIRAAEARHDYELLARLLKDKQRQARLTHP